MAYVRHWQPAWRMSLRLMGYWYAPLCAGLIGFLLLTNAAPRAVEAVVPLLVGIGAALAFSADDEPSLELILAAPRPLYWLLLERLAVVLLTHFSIGLVFTFALQMRADAEPLATALLRWLAPACALGGLGLYTAMVMRRGSYGVLVVVLLYGALLFGGDSLVGRFEVLWPLHIFMQPYGPADWYVVNRLVGIALGAALVVLSFRHVRNEEALLAALRNG